MTVRDLFQLEGQVAGVTVGSSGLCPQMALALGEMGGRVAITARKADALVQARDELASQDIEVLTLVGDLPQLDCIQALVEEAVSRLGAIDIPVTRTPLQRQGGDEDLRGSVVFRASAASRHITGQVLAVDGGTSAL